MTTKSYKGSIRRHKLKNDTSFHINGDSIATIKISNHNIVLVAQTI